jgi:chromosome segregation ATPase
MNIQDIADFIDLIKNPDKYDKLLKDLVDEQERLKAVIKTVGDVAEIESIKTQIKLDEKQAILDREAILTKIEQDRVKENVATTVLQADLQATRTKYQTLYQDLQEKEAETKELNKLAKKREKDLVSKQAELQEKLNNVEALKLELEDRLAKLKAVMV